MPELATRVEHDLLGEREVPSRVLFGIHADRAVENFGRPGGLRLGDVPEFAAAYGMVKLAALRANVDAGIVTGTVASALGTACIELARAEPRLLDALVVPLLQGGAGTSTNMNVNEVLANRALELMGFPPGRYERCHPNDHVNRSQSTNDTYPTALRLALKRRGDRLADGATALAQSLRRKGSQFAGVEKLGRTQLQDAVPLLVEDEFSAWADAIDAAVAQVRISGLRMLEVNLGGTAIGTGLTAPEGFAERAVEHLAQISGQDVTGAPRRVSATTEVSGLLGASAALRELALAVAKLANDLRLLASGPQAGLSEIDLPAMQGGSSMMPGKVNPVVPEFVNQIAFRVRGADATVAAALDAGQLQLHAMLPAVAEALFVAQDDLHAAVEAMRIRCVDGIRIDADRLRAQAKLGLGELSLTASRSGYALATGLALAERPQLTEHPEHP